MDFLDAVEARSLSLNTQYIGNHFEKIYGSYFLKAGV